MFICIYLCNIMDLSATQTQQNSKKPFKRFEVTNPSGLPYLHTQLHFVLADRGICSGPGGHTMGENSHRMSSTQPGFPSPSFPPSFFPLNCNLLPLLPLYVAVHGWDDAFGVNPVCNLRILTRIYLQEKMAKSETSCNSESHTVSPPFPPPRRDNRKKKKKKDREKCLQSGCLPGVRSYLC